jgi:hypothetical protein
MTRTAAAFAREQTKALAGNIEAVKGYLLESVPDATGLHMTEADATAIATAALVLYGPSVDDLAHERLARIIGHLIGAWIGIRKDPVCQP